MWDLEKHGTDDLICRAKREIQMKKCVGTLRAGGGRRDWEAGTDMCTLVILWIKQGPDENRARSGRKPPQHSVLA